MNVVGPAGEADLGLWVHDGTTFARVTGPEETFGGDGHQGGVATLTTSAGDLVVVGHTLTDQQWVEKRSRVEVWTRSADNRWRRAWDSVGLMLQAPSAPPPWLRWAMVP